MYKKCAKGEFKFEVGHEFITIKAFRIEIKEYVLREKFHILRKENEKRRFVREYKYKSRP